ncbi:hypothetical protein BS47DRAFT_1336061 [Hydnum rufescens UP504]|uniref:Uncharacterized protein n=1 Tax=Hydnum rufescens UP504 TaxID=1448309 RepID=A0A9P6E205_9AGAM|nr:hypothetical protein BS47DRAFT_1336061 [Hydnum rufescens UP504]
MSALREESSQVSTDDTSGPGGWDKCIKEFFSTAGFHETIRAFELEMLVMNSTFEKEVIPGALAKLVHDLADEKIRDSRELEERKVDYVQDAVHAVSPRTLNRSISHMLAMNRARNNTSNTLEFLRPAKRRRVGGDLVSTDMDGVPDGEDVTMPVPTSARTDAIKVDRDVQMKYDVATVSQGDGLLKRTVHVASAGATPTAAHDLPATRDEGQGAGGIKNHIRSNIPTLERHPGLGERFRNIEDHLAIRYVPGPPEDIRLRLKSIEEHIIRLEREYPPWAAFHFNQPRRTASHPIQPTPIVIPAHLTTPIDPVPPRSSEPQFSTASAGASLLSAPLGSRAGPSTGASSSRTAKGKERASGKPLSSLHRAVMEKLEIMKVKSENGGAGGDVG